MLAFFRRYLGSWLAIALFGLIMLAFVITGVGTKSGGLGAMGSGAQWLAQAGDYEITAPDFGRELERQLARIREEQKQPGLDMAALIRQGGFEEILTAMIADKSIIAFAHKHGMTVSKRMIDSEIAGMSVFQNAAGDFDNNVFRQRLATAKISEREFRDSLESDLMKRQVLPAIGFAASAGNELARPYASLLLETRTGSGGIVPAQAFAGGPPPSDAEIAAYFRQHVARYTIPERRVLRYGSFGIPDVAAAAQATDAEIAAYYKANADTYAAKENRNLSQVVLPTQQAAQAVADKIKAGKSFDQAATEAGFSAADTAIGDLTQADLARRFTPQVAAAAFSLPSGGVTAPVRSPLGWHVLKVNAVHKIAGKPLEAVHAEIAQKVSAAKAQQALGDLVGKIEDEIGGGASFEQAVRDHKLTVVETPPITAAGAAPGVAGYRMPAEVGPLLKPASDMSPDDDPVVQTVAQGQRYALLAVARVVPAAPPPLAEIKDKVRTDMMAERALTRARAVATAILAKVNGGMPIRQAFAQAGTPLPPIQDMKARRMDVARSDSKAPPAVQALFGLAKGKARLLPAPNGAGWFVVQLDAVLPGDLAQAPGLLEATRGQLGTVLADEISDQFVTALERDINVRHNQSAILQMKRQLLSGGEAVQN